MKLLLVNNQLDFETVVLSNCDNIQDHLKPFHRFWVVLGCFGVVSHTTNHKWPSDGRWNHLPSESLTEIKFSILITNSHVVKPGLRSSPQNKPV